MSDYQTLLGTMGEYLDAENDEVSARIPDFIRIQQGWIDLDYQLMEQQTTIPDQAGADSVYLPLPSDYLSLKSIRPSWDGSLDQVAPEALKLWTGRPRQYAIEGQQIEFDAVLSSELTVRLVYYARLAPLVNDTDTNWFLQQAWGVYLYGALLQSVPFLRGTSPEAVASWDTAYTRQRRLLKDYEAKQKRVAGRNVQRMRYSTP